MHGTIDIEGLSLRLRPVRRPGHRHLTYIDVKYEGRWLDCGDPVHGDLTTGRAHAALAHYARVAIRKAQEAQAKIA